MSKGGIDAELVRLAAAQAKAFLPAKKRPSGRKKYGAGKIVVSDPNFWAKVHLGSLYQSAAAKDLFGIYVRKDSSLNSFDKRKFAEMRPRPMQRLLKRFKEAVAAKDFAAVYTIAKAVEMFSKGTLLAYPRKHFIAATYVSIVQKYKRPPTPISLAKACQARHPGVFKSVLDEAIFREIRELQLPVASSKANKIKKKR